MTRRTKTTERMSARVEKLLATFPACLHAFDSSRVFSGPSTYFHQKAVALRGSQSVAQAVEDTALIEAIYATLASWGMHRMGPGGAKLVEFPAFKAGIVKALPFLVELESTRLTTLSKHDVDSVSESVWKAITLVQASASKTQIVAGSKTLHHFLPELITPIDRTYTLTFFYNHKTLAAPEDDTFDEIFPLLRTIAQDARANVSRTGPMYSSATKTIDNAIVGYVRLRKRTLPNWTIERALCCGSRPISFSPSGVIANSWTC